MNTMDRVEEETDPHAQSDPAAETTEIQRRGRRLRVFDNDVRKYGFTDSCQRCEFLRQGKNILDRGTRHNEECRGRIYDAMRIDGAEKLQRADLEGSERTLTRHRKAAEPEVVPNTEAMDARPSTEDPPAESLVDMEQTVDNATPTMHEQNQVDDT